MTCCWGFSQKDIITIPQLGERVSIDALPRHLYLLAREMGIWDLPLDQEDRDCRSERQISHPNLIFGLLLFVGRQIKINDIWRKSRENPQTIEL